jgi:hypothetical protein
MPSHSLKYRLSVVNGLFQPAFSGFALVKFKPEKSDPPRCILLKFAATVIFIICLDLFGMTDEQLSEEYRISLGSSDSFSKFLIASPALKLIVSPALFKLLTKEASSAKDILQLINETSRALSGKKDEILNQIMASANKSLSLSEAIPSMQTAKDCLINRSQKRTDSLPKNSDEIAALNKDIPEMIRKHTHFLISLVDNYGKKDVIYEWLFKLSEQHVWTMKIFPIKTRYCWLTSVDVFVLIRNYEHVLFLDIPTDY